MEVFEIYFDDLNEKAQKELLQLANITDPCEMNWDVIPLTTIEVEED